MATYVATTHARRNCKVITNTIMNRVICDGHHKIKVELSTFPGFPRDTVKVTPRTGKVVLPAVGF